MPVLNWSELSTVAFSDLAADDYIAVLPLGATEQHGPHLPVGTDSTIACGMVDALRSALPAEANIIFLPLVPVSNSVEHTNRPGTLSLGRDLTFRVLMALGADIARVGLRKVLLINAHGGNVGVMVDASHALRAEHGLFCVATNWMRLGLPDGVVDEARRAVDIHGGEIETSLMLKFAPETVDLRSAGQFASLQSALVDEFAVLRAYGPVGFGWMGDDLHPAGVVGDAAAASPGKGEAIMAHQARVAVRLLDEMAQFNPPWFR